MKGDLTILDQPYQHAVRELSQALDDRDIQYSIYGGGAVQMHQLAAATKQGKKPSRDSFRKTGDIDLAVGESLEQMLVFFNELTALGVASNTGAGSASIGPVQINYCVPGKVKGFEDRHAYLLDHCSTIPLQLGRGRVWVSVEDPELVIAAKLTGSLKPKDTLDIRRLRATGVSDAAVRKVLAELGMPEKFDLYASIIKNPASTE